MAKSVRSSARTLDVERGKRSVPTAPFIAPLRHPDGQLCVCRAVCGASVCVCALCASPRLCSCLAPVPRLRMKAVSFQRSFRLPFSQPCWRLRSVLTSLFALFGFAFLLLQGKLTQAVEAMLNVEKTQRLVRALGSRCAQGARRGEAPVGLPCLLHTKLPLRQVISTAQPPPRPAACSHHTMQCCAIAAVSGARSLCCSAPERALPPAWL